MEDTKNSLPVHVAIIMDGNGRWATKRGLPRSAGHKAGLTATKNIVRSASILGIKYITLYAFSTENWKRTADEVGYLMGLVKWHLRAEFDFYKENGIRLMHIGDIDGLPADVKNDILKAIDETAGFNGTVCTLAINYGGRDEIARAVKKIVASNVPPNDISEDTISSCLDAPNLPDVDLLIRTGGEERISNFLLWQSSYAELIFSKTLWPDYGEQEFRAHILEFQQRTRRFGDAK